MVKKTEKAMRICITLLVMNLIFIWGNSLLPGSVSEELSQWVKDLLSRFFRLEEGSDSTGGGILRKFAHLTEFACLGLLLCWLFSMLKKKLWVPVLWGFSVACTDETIQLFVPDRGPGIWDVGIDTVGVLLGVCIFTIWLKLYYKNKKQKNIMEETKL